MVGTTTVVANGPAETVPPGTTSAISSASTSTKSSVSTATSPSGQKSTSPPKSGLAGNPGAAAGLAIGGVIVGAIIAALLFFLLTKSRRSKKRSHGEDYEITPTSSTGKRTTRVTISLPEDSAAAIVENNLPQPAEDNAIIGDLSRLKNKIDGHVQTFYSIGPVDSKFAAQALQPLLHGSPFEASRIATLLSDPKSRPFALRAALAWIIISRIGTENNGKASFLPTSVIGAPYTLPPTKMDEKTRTAFLSKYRQITAALSGNTFSQETMSENDPRLTNIRNAVREADQFLAPFAKDADQSRLRNLEEIMKRAARLGFLLFSQPSSVLFDWQEGSTALVIFPGLLQISNDDGKALASPRVFAQKELALV